MPADDWPDELLHARVRFWVCPIVEHRRRENVVTVEWRGNIAHCTAPGCSQSSGAGTGASDGR